MLKNPNLGKAIVVWGIIAIPLLLALPHLFNYKYLRSYQVLTLLAIPFMLQVKPKERIPISGILAICTFCLFFILRLQTIFFTALGLTLLFFIERLYGRQSIIFLILTVLCSSFMEYLVKIFSFPIRLQLSKLASYLFQLVHIPIESAGNVMQINGEAFYVDPSCVGMNMFLLSFVLCSILIGLSQSFSNRSFSISKIALIFGVNFLLVLLTNLFRIILLVVFKSAPDSSSHDILGLLCFLLINVAPLAAFISYLAKGKQLPKPNIELDKRLTSRSIGIILLSTIGFISFNSNTLLRRISNIQSEAISIKGFTKTTVEDNVLKFEAAHALAYIKPPVAFYSSDHTPAICWRGSGYKFKHEKVIHVNGNDYFYSELTKGKDKLHTVWFYKSCKSQTIKQMDWRWKTFKEKESFHLVNITCENYDTLINTLQTIEIEI